MSTAATAGRTGVDLLALLTFVLASLWLFGLGSLAALHVGRKSLRRLETTPGVRGRTVAWAGIAVAIWGLALTALWIGLSLTA